MSGDGRIPHATAFKQWRRWPLLAPEGSLQIHALDHWFRQAPEAMGMLPEEAADPIFAGAERHRLQGATTTPPTSLFSWKERASNRIGLNTIR